MHRYKTFTGSDCAIHSVIKPLTVHGRGIQEQWGEGDNYFQYFIKASFSKLGED